MNLAFQIALAAHIISGMAALFSGFIAIVSSKGKMIHRKSGLVYFISMLTVCLSAVFISVMKQNTFLLHIGIFAFFMVFSGYRSIRNKTLKPYWYDYLVLLLGLLNGFLMVISMKLVLMVFGAIGAYFAISDARLFLKTNNNIEIPQNQWLIRHIGMMLGAYISTFTAFLVVNVSWNAFPWVPWLIPTIIGSPLIAYWTRKITLDKKV
jgi:uncharacterized membrane protein